MAADRGDVAWEEGAEVKYSKRTVDEAVQLLDVYASQMFWTPTDHHSLDEVCEALGLPDSVWNLAFDTWRKTEGDLHWTAAESAQRLREGWRP